MTPDRLLAHFDRIAEAPDAVPRLRQFILDLAVRGKLVEQDPKDEPASELLDRIRAERERLIQKRHIRRGELQAAIDDDGPPFALAELWAWCRLGEVIHLVSGQHLQPGEYSDQKQSGPPYITGPADFGENGLVITRYATVRKAVANEGQILLTVKGAGVGKTAVCDLPEVAISRQLMAMTAIQWSQQFLLLTAHRLATALKESARSLIPGISRDDVEQFVFGLPPLAEQHRIVAKVDELMALCDRLEAAQAEREKRRDRLAAASLHRLDHGADAHAFREHARFHLRHLPRLTTRREHIQQLRQTILNLAVCGKLVPQNPTDEPATLLLDSIASQRTELLKQGYPNRDEATTQLRKQAAQQLPSALEALAPGSQWSTLMQASLIVVDCHNKTAPYVGSGIRLLRTTSIRDGRLNLLDPKFVDEATYERWSARCKPQGGDILITREAPMGEVCIIPDGMKICMGQRMMLIRLVAGTVDPSFLLYSLMDPSLMNRVQDKPVGATVQHLRVGGVETLLVPLPPLAEQHRIVAKVDELMALCDRLEAQLAISEAESRRLLEAVLHEALLEKDGQDGEVGRAAETGRAPGFAPDLVGRRV